MPHEDVIIVGAGISGLSCARRLADQGRRFRMLTESVGGRIVTSADGRVNHGAYFVAEDYRHVLPWVTRGRRISPFRVEFHRAGGRGYFWYTCLRHPRQLWRFFRLAVRFRRHLARFRTRTLQVGQQAALEQDPWLLHLYRQPAEDLIREYRIRSLAAGFISEVLWACAFSTPQQLRAFEFLHFGQYSLWPVHEFTFDVERITRGFADHIELDPVQHLLPGQGTDAHRLVTRSGIAWTARHVVIATPPQVAQRLLHLPAIKRPASAWMFHLVGHLRRDRAHGIENLYSPGSPVFSIDQQTDGSWLFYSPHADPPLDSFFHSHRVLARRHWAPAFHLDGTALLPGQFGHRVWLAGDANVCGLEDAAITGIHAARQILAE
ncbi:MAG: FAD-dependent oxidoreductase [Planctomycetota bacterium]